MKKEIKIGDSAFTFIRTDRHPISKRIVIKIIDQETGKRIVFRPTLEPEYHSHEETTEVDISEVYLDVEYFKKYIKNCRDLDIQEYIKKTKNVYKEFLSDYKLSN